MTWAGKKLTVVDYGVGNLGSVANALERVGIPFEVSGDLAVVVGARVLLLPGVGAAAYGMQNLQSRSLDTAIIAAVKNGTPILGVCLGMQLLFSKSEEGDVACLDLVPGTVKEFRTNLKVPHMGWNRVAAKPDSKLLKNLSGEYFYFVHSFYCAPEDGAVTTGTTDYDKEFCSVLETGNVYGAQFHPEKSGPAGAQLLKNFWEAAC